MPIYIVHYKPGTKMFAPSDDPTRGHTNYTSNAELTNELLKKDKSVAKWYFIPKKEIKPCNTSQPLSP